jgi:hypothetical protein
MIFSGKSPKWKTWIRKLRTSPLKKAGKKLSSPGYGSTAFSDNRTTDEMTFHFRFPNTLTDYPRSRSLAWKRTHLTPLPRRPRRSGGTENVFWKNPIPNRQSRGSRSRITVRRPRFEPLFLNADRLRKRMAPGTGNSRFPRRDASGLRFRHPFDPYEKRSDDDMRG